MRVSEQEGGNDRHQDKEPDNDGEVERGRVPVHLRERILPAQLMESAEYELYQKLAKTVKEPILVMQFPIDSLGASSAGSRRCGQDCQEAA